MQPRKLNLSIASAAMLPMVRKEPSMSLAAIAEAGLRGGADGILLHLTDERWLVREDDFEQVRRVCSEMDRSFQLRLWSAGPLITTALKFRPDVVCLTAESKIGSPQSYGLSFRGNLGQIKSACQRLKDIGARCYVSIDAGLEAVENALKSDVDGIEFDTSDLCDAIRGGNLKLVDERFTHLSSMARYASRHGLGVQAGHGLDFEAQRLLARVPQIRGINMGRYLIGGALMHGLTAMVAEAKGIMLHAGSGLDGLDARRQACLYRANYRGFREMDIIMSSFAQAVVPALVDPDLFMFEHILEMPDHDLYERIRSTNEPEQGLHIELLTNLRDHYKQSRWLCQ
ncbi:pyridoxine 5'-phosphate synthase [Asticcacaulis biprosthecium C19]|uniref:FAD assembly factor SdhE n=2 Tax=Asticcacaulis biprosthecium TaxID=76891 RepID=F4QR84_9CAUL|nr:pyridoxine 5'-phosphate synthase [Asticcacaulis biprosthecium C19]